MEKFTKGWFTELSPDVDHTNESVHLHKTADGRQISPDDSPLDEKINKGWKGQAFSLKVDQVLFHEKSDYQDVLIFKSESYGTVLVLDGVIQCTERDEFSYQEMLAHLPMTLNPSAKQVLIIGGGDGGILREVLKHPHVESVVLCEIDKKVVDACKKYLPSMAASFGHPKVTLHIGDGLEFMKKNQNRFDVIITDSSDPIGPAETLFTDSYYHLLNGALTENGVLASQAESIWLHLDMIKRLVKFCRKIFPSVGYAYSSVPTYPSGVIGYLICSKIKDCKLEEPKVEIDGKKAVDMNMRFYNAQIHRASFVLPQFAAKVLACEK
uniref:Spermidine synthase n=1 Tax=Romanomermis culicivorax TaxID=13658 RepID=A0A915KXW6_ROMCU